MNRRPIKSHNELETALAQRYPLGMFDDIASRTLCFDNRSEAPYKRGYGVEMSIVPKDGKEYPYSHVDTKIYFPLHLPVDDNDHLLNPLGGVKSEWIEKDMHYEYTGATFLFGVCKIDPKGALNKDIRSVPGISFYVVNNAERAHLITHIMAIREVRGNATSDDAVYWRQDYHYCRTPNSDESDCYCRYTRALKNGKRFKMELYPIGFSFMETDDDGDYAWGGNFYKTLADFIAARKEYVRGEYRKILQEQEEISRDSNLEKNTSEQGTPKVTMDLDKPTSEMTIVELCNYLNAKLNELQKDYAQKNLGEYELGSGAFVAEKLSLKRGDASSPQTRTEALRHVTHLELVAKSYKE